ncbi:MAG: hypothetical protein AAFR36_24835, partial [Bacteroidota bacterium]
MRLFSRIFAHDHFLQKNYLTQLTKAALVAEPIQLTRAAGSTKPAVKTHCNASLSRYALILLHFRNGIVQIIRSFL